MKAHAACCDGNTTTLLIVVCSVLTINTAVLTDLLQIPDLDLRCDIVCQCFDDSTCMYQRLSKNGYAHFLVAVCHTWHYVPLRCIANLLFGNPSIKLLLFWSALKITQQFSCTSINFTVLCSFSFCGTVQDIR